MSLRLSLRHCGGLAMPPLLANAGDLNSLALNWRESIRLAADPLPEPYDFMFVRPSRLPEQLRRLQNRTTLPAKCHHQTIGQNPLNPCPTTVDTGAPERGTSVKIPPVNPTAPVEMY